MAEHEEWITEALLNQPFKLKALKAANKVINKHKSETKHFLSWKYCGHIWIALRTEGSIIRQISVGQVNSKDLESIYKELLKIEHVSSCFIDRGSRYVGDNMVKCSDIGNKAATMA